MKKYIALLLFFCSFSFVSAFVEDDIDTYTNMTGGCFVVDTTFNQSITIAEPDEVLILNIVRSETVTVTDATRNGLDFIFTGAQGNSTNGGADTVLEQYFLPNPDVGTFNISVSAGLNGCLAFSAIAVKNLELNPTLPLEFSYLDTSATPVTTFTQTLDVADSGAFLNWTVTAQSGGTITGNLQTTPYSQPEVFAFGAGSAYNQNGATGGNVTMTMQLSSGSQNFRGLIVSYPSTSGGGGGTTTQDYDFNLGQLTTEDIFGMGSTTISFGAIDYTACDVTSISVNPFASSSLSWGTFDIPQCVLQSFKLLLFGTNGFDTYNITNFINTSSSTLPFLMFKFMGGALIYINPLTGELINLPSASSSLVFSVPMFGTTTPILFDVKASSSAISSLQIPETMDKVLATVEIVVFFVLWATIFRYINI